VSKLCALLVDDHASFGESVARALSTEPDLRVAFCTTIAAGLEALQREPIDILLLDHNLGAERASQFLPAARRAGFSGHVLIVTAGISDNEARRLLRQGVSGIFLKGSKLEALAASIRTISNGGTSLDERFGNLVPDDGPGEAVGDGPQFNERQREVLRCVLEGLSNKVIAARLQISESYVKALVQVLFRKTGVRTRGQLVRVALEQYQDEL